MNPHHLRTLTLCYVGVSLCIPSRALPQTQQGVSTLSLPISIATLQAQDKISASRSPATPQFSLQSVSKDGTRLFVSVNEVGDFQDETKTVRFANWTIQDVALNVGSIPHQLAKIRGDFQWFGGEPGVLALPNIKTDALTNDPTQPALNLTVGIPTNEPPPKDVLIEFMPNGLIGKGIYTPTILVSGEGDSSQWRTFLILRRVGRGENTVQTFPVQTQAEVFGPQWSPDGQTVLLKVGLTGDRYNIYRIHFWNPQTGQLWQGPSDRTSYLHPQWSPDSQKVGYIVGGDISGFNDSPEPLSLHVYDMQTHQSRKLASAIPTFGTPADFAWEDAHTLLYTQPPPSISMRDETPGFRSAFRPHVYEVAANGSEPKRLLQNAFGARPSPDGKHIAFFGWPDESPKDAEQKTTATQALTGARLFIWERATGKRVAVEPPIRQAGTQVAWTPDSKKLILLQASYDTEKALGNARISAVSLNK